MMSFWAGSVFIGTQASSGFGFSLVGPVRRRVLCVLCSAAGVRGPARASLPLCPNLSSICQHILHVV